MYLCVLCKSENKQLLFPFTALTDWFYNRYLTLYSPIVTIYTTSLTFTNSTFCPQSVFMWFVWISEQTAIISLYNINWLVFYNRDLPLYSPMITIYIYHQFNIHKFYFLFPQWIYVFCIDIRTNSDYFRIQHKLTDFYNRDLTLYSPAVNICTTSLTFNNSTFCPHSIFMCFVWIWEQTAIISLYNINRLVFITETESVYCVVRTGSLNIISYYS